MILSAIVAKCATCFVPAFLGSAAITPIITVADVAVIKSATTGSMVKSVLDASKEYRFDEKSNLTFGCAFSTLVVSNWFLDDRLKTLSGIAVNTGLSMWKDSIYMGGSLSHTTRFLFVLKDVMSIIPSLTYPELCFVKKAFLVFLSQVPCTLVNAYAMDVHIFKQVCGRRKRIWRSFCANLPIRVLKSVFGSTLACQINYGVLKRM